MGFILCKKCGHGSPDHFQFCGNCNADLFDESNVETAPAEPPVDESKVARNQKIAVGLSFVTTAFKIWALYGLETEAHLGFPQMRDLLAIGLAPLGALIASFRSKRWHWILIIDSAVVIAFVLFILFVFVASRFAKR